jgi:hypothetical protein
MVYASPVNMTHTFPKEIMMRHFASILALLVAAASTPALAAENPQHQRMRDCNQTAKTKALKGDERKAFMKTCLSSKKDDTKVAPVAKAKPKAS